MNTRLSAASRRMQEQEVAVLIAIQSLTSAPMTRRGAVLLSHVGEHAVTWTALGLLGAGLDPPQRRLWLRATATVLSAHALSIVAKRGVRRHRPSDPRVQVHVTTPSDWSFPSSHAASTTAAAMAYSTLLGRRYPLLLIPLMLTSRVALGVHYPSDVLAGSLVGAALARRLAPARLVSPS